MIPHTVHQIWIGESDAPPAVYRPHWIASWRALNPAWDYRLWTAAPLSALAERHYAEFLPVLDCAATPNVVKADFARLLLLHRFGGVYSDLDAQCLRPLDALTGGRRFVAGKIEENYIGNSFLAAESGHALTRALLTACLANWRAWRASGARGRVEALAGPEATGPLIERHADAYLAPPAALYPFSWLKGEASCFGSIPRRLLESATAEDFPESCVVTFYAHHW